MTEAIHFANPISEHGENGQFTETPVLQLTLLSGRGSMDTGDTPKDGAGGDSPDLKKQLFEACEKLEFDKITDLLPKVGFNALDDENRYPMGLIARSQHPEQQDTSSCPHTVLLQHIKKHFPNEYEKNITQKDENQREILGHAAVSDCTILLDYLVNVEKCPIDQPSGSKGETPLIVSSIWNRTNSLKYFLDSGKCDVNAKDQSYDMTGLLWAAYYLNINAAEVIMKDPRCSSVMSQKNSDDEDILVNCLESYEDCTPAEDTCKHLQMLKLIKSHVPEEEFKKCLLSKDTTGMGLAMRAAGSDCLVTMQFLKDAGVPMDEANNDGDTPIYKASQHGYCKAVSFLIANKCKIEHVSNSGETPFLRACWGTELESAKLLVEAGADMKVKDLGDNTALHSICSRIPESEKYEDYFCKLFVWLSDLEKCTAGNCEPMLQKMRAINLSGHNIPLTLADSNVIKLFLKLKEIEPFKEQLAPLFSNSDGLNILHVYIAKHNLEELHKAFNESPFANLWDELINGKVQQGSFRGYGCLHFACQTGHMDNINYLLEKYPDRMKLKDRFLSEFPSPMDVLIKHRHEHLLPKLRFVTFHQVIESIDNIQTALDLLPVDQAKQALLPLCTPDLKTVVINPQSHRNEKYKSGRVEDTSGIVYPAGVKLFHLALKEDSPEIFRNILALGLWTYLGTQKAADDYNSYICQQILGKDSGDATLVDELPDSHRGFGHYLKWQPKDAKSVCFNLTSPSLLGIAIRSGRIKIAKDLILVNQYNLVPTCLLVIQECQFLLNDGKVIAECVEDLRNYALNVALNALDELDKSADENRLKLLHMYTGGRFHPGNCSDPDCFGPKFSYFGRQTECTEFELAVGCGCDEVVASDGLLRCSKTEWAEPTIGQDTAMSPLTKYRIHSASFLIFLCFFTYYVITIEDETSWLDIVILLFAISFVLQEALQFFDTDDVYGYITDGWNYLDIGGILLLMVSLIWKLHEDTVKMSNHFSTSGKYFIIRMMLSIAHMIWGFRFISFLRSFELIGPTINIIKTLLKRDLLPFMILFLSMCLSFGIFFYNLLNPDMRVYSSNGLVGKRDNFLLLSIMTRPLMTSFGNLDLGDISNCEDLSAEWLKFNETEASAAPSAPACTHPVGTFHYRNYLILPFLFLINLTMLNVLIAKFSMTVASQEDVAYMIWRRGDIDLLNDYVGAPALPPPFTIFWVIYVILRRLSKRFGWTFRIFCLPGDSGGNCCYQPVAGDDGCDRHRSWWPAARMEKMLGQPMGIDTDEVLASDGEKEFAVKFKEFLLYQACTFHRLRCQFTRDRKDHGPVVEKLQIDIRNLSRSGAIRFSK